MFRVSSPTLRTVFTLTIRPSVRLLSAILVTSLGVVTASCTNKATSAKAPALPPTPSPSPAPVQKAKVMAKDQADFFDAKRIHAISVSFQQGDYDQLIESYKQNNTKEWMKADVTIDGRTYRQAGMRLKGNSSLFSIGGRRRGGFAGAANLADGAFPPGFAGDGGPGGSADAKKPESLPWLIRLDKYVDDQAHQGNTEFVVRSSTTKTALNEIVALELLERAGLASERSASVRLRMNSSPAILRLVIESPNQQWMERWFGARGQLYKADSTGDYSYRGTDPESYRQAWSQEAGDKDISPLIEFLKFVNNSSDFDFEAKLPDRFDVDSFARYLAIQELFNNFDDIDGPGNNSYLHYDQAAKRFTVVAWDHNLAFLGFPFGGGEFGHVFGGVGGVGGLRGDTGSNPDTDTGLGGLLPAPDTTSIAADTVPEAPASPDKFFPSFLQKSNALVSRFHKVASFEAKYEAAKNKLASTVFGDDAKALLKQRAAVITAGASDLIDRATVVEESATIEAALQASP